MLHVIITNKAINNVRANRNALRAKLESHASARGRNIAKIWDVSEIAAELARVESQLFAMRRLYHAARSAQLAY